MSEASPITAPVQEAQFHETPAFTPEQLKIIASDAVAAGKMTRGEADEALQSEHGIMPAPQKPAETLAPEAAEIDAAFPPGRPHEYTFPIDTPGREPTAERLAAEHQARNWLSAARFPREHGSSLAAEIDRVGAAWQQMAPSERQLYSIREQQKLDALWGASKADNLNTARQLIRELEAKQPGVTAVLDRSGAGHSAAVIVQVHAQAKRLAMRKR